MSEDFDRLLTELEYMKRELAAVRQELKDLKEAVASLQPRSKGLSNKDLEQMLGSKLGFLGKASKPSLPEWSLLDIRHNQRYNLTLRSPSEDSTEIKDAMLLWEDPQLNVGRSPNPTQETSDDTNSDTE